MTMVSTFKLFMSLASHTAQSDTDDDSVFCGSRAQIGDTVPPRRGQTIGAHFTELLGVGSHDALLVAA